MLARLFGKHYIHFYMFFYLQLRMIISVGIRFGGIRGLAYSNETLLLLMQSLRKVLIKISFQSTPPSKFESEMQFH